MTYSADPDIQALDRRGRDARNEVMTMLRNALRAWLGKHPRGRG